jgi:hypothetical protein
VCSDPTITANANTFKFLGNVSTFQVTIEEETVTEKDYTSCGGGADCSVSMIDSVNLEIETNCWSRRNLDFAFYGDSQEIAPGLAFAETFFVGADPEEALVPLTFLPDETNNPVLVQSIANGVTYVQGVDYYVSANGLVLTPATTIPANQDLDITYDYSASTAVDLLTGQSSEIELFFDGRNCANGDKPFQIRLYKVTLTPASEMDFIGDDFGSITLNGTVLSDCCVQQTYNPFSQYGKIQFA